MEGREGRKGRREGRKEGRKDRNGMEKKRKNVPAVRWPASPSYPGSSQSSGLFILVNMVTVSVVRTSPYDGQKPGTSGLRKAVPVFKQQHYTENFVQCILDAIPEDKRRGCVLVVGGDGRYFMKEAIQVIVRMAAANEVMGQVINRKEK